MKRLSFEAEIAENKSLETLTDPHVTELAAQQATLQIRERGCYVTEGVLYSPALEERVSVMYSDADISKPKLTASHPMSPVGPYDGVGGQHGFPRWADYKEFPLADSDDGEKHAAFQAKRSDSGLALAKTFKLSNSALTSDVVIHNPDATPEHTSLGEHLYFSLANENFSGLTVNSLTLDELLGEGSEETIKEGTPLFWQAFSGSVAIKFPAGHEIKLSTKVVDAPEDTLGMLVWHRPGSESVCFEPTLGFDPENRGDGLTVEPYETVGLSTSIELL